MTESSPAPAPGDPQAPRSPTEPAVTPVPSALGTPDPSALATPDPSALATPDPSAASTPELSAASTPDPDEDGLGDLGTPGGDLGDDLDGPDGAFEDDPDDDLGDPDDDGLLAGPDDGAGVLARDDLDEPEDLGPGTEDVVLRVWRGDATGGHLVDYTLPAQDGEVVLDVVHRIQATVAPDLACRWNCKAGKCGSCSSEINGKPRLMCMTRVDELPPGPITVTPMRTFPIVRDLVTDVSYNYEVASRVPAFAPGRPPPGGYRMQQVDIERGQEFRKCIECFLCQDVCHVIRDHEENKPNYAGPRFFIRFAELEMHPLDTNDRRELVRQRMGLGMCNITKCCTEVCPEHIKITDNGIIPMKERVVDASYDPVAWLGRKILRRRKRSPAEAAAELP